MLLFCGSSIGVFLPRRQWMFLFPSVDAMSATSGDVLPTTLDIVMWLLPSNNPLYPSWEEDQDWSIVDLHQVRGILEMGSHGTEFDAMCGRLIRLRPILSVCVYLPFVQMNQLGVPKFNVKKGEA